MNVFIISPTLSHGGAERVATLWAKGLARNGYHLYFVTNLHSESSYDLESVERLLPLTPSSNNKIKKYLGSIRLLRKYYKTYKPDVIIGVMYACSLLAKLSSIGLSIPVINTEHSAFERPTSFPFTRIDYFAKFFLNYLYDGVTVLTQKDKLLINKRFNNVHVLPNPTFITPIDRYPIKESVVLAAGRLDAWECKGFDVLIRAWGKIVKSEELTVNRDGWRLQIAGTGSEKSLNYLKGLCKEYGVDNSVEFLGFQKDIEKLYQKASIFVLSSRYEGFGMVLVEAMSQGCACIACDYKGRQKEIIRNDYEGKICEIDDVDSLTIAIEDFIQDKHKRETVGVNSIARSHDFSIDNIINKWDDVFNSVSKKRA